jgi:hypothetical protein
MDERRKEQLKGEKQQESGQLVQFSFVCVCGIACLL